MADQGRRHAVTGRAQRRLRTEQQAAQTAHGAAEIEEALLWLGLAVRGWGAAGCGMTESSEPPPDSESIMAPAGAIESPSDCALAGPGASAGPAALTTVGPPAGTGTAAGKILGRRVDLLLAADELLIVSCFVWNLVRDCLEAVLGGHQRAVEFVERDLLVGHPVLIGRLHLLITMVLGRDDAVLEDHISPVANATQPRKISDSPCDCRLQVGTARR